MKADAPVSSEPRVPLSRPDIDDTDRAAVMAVLERPTLSLGPEVEAFAAEFAAYLSPPDHDPANYDPVFASAVSSGTAGLYLALRALGIESGEVITPSYGFIATAHAIGLAGATPIFCDVDPITQNVTVETLERVRSERTVAVVPVDLFGTPLDMAAIVDWARAHRLVVVEDACEALGSHQQGQLAGSRGDAGVFAFYPNKQMTTGEGGMVVSRHRDVIERVECLANQGRGQGEFRFVAAGFNFRMSEMPAALGRSQLARIESIIACRADLARRYRERLAVVPAIATLDHVPPGDRRSWFVFPVVVAEPAWRDGLRATLTSAGIQTSPYFPAVHRFAPYADPALCPAPVPVTERLSASSFAIPFFNRLDAADLDLVCMTLERALPDGAATYDAFSLQTLVELAT